VTARRAALPALVLAVVGLLPSAAAADDMFGLRVGYYTDAEAACVGGEALFKLAPKVYLNPNIEWVFVDHARYVTLNADVHYDFWSRRRNTAWIGAGLALVSIDPEGPADGDTDPALNVFAGFGARRGSVLPYVQAKVIARDDTELVLAFGLRF
jgi:hypothetical protein